jgi:hypothetical protein
MRGGGIDIRRRSKGELILDALGFLAAAVALAAGYDGPILSTYDAGPDVGEIS